MELLASIIRKNESQFIFIPNNFDIFAIQSPNYQSYMQIIKSVYSDFEHYNDVINDWELDFNLLSKNNFNAYLNMSASVKFSLIRTKLNGKIEQRGLTPAGYVTIGIPINYNSSYFWLNKRVSGKDMLIFPKSRTLDGVSYSDFDNYVISIKESTLFETIENLGYKNCNRIFDGSEQTLFLTKEFSQRFHQLASHFLSTNIKTDRKQNVLIDNMIYTLLNYIESSNESPILIPQKRKDIAVRKAVDIINSQIEDVLSIQQLCKLTEVSERTLQYAFINKYKITPSEYVKAVRLNNVKRELSISKDNGRNISYIAGKYNFWHMGQFAKDFRLQFGKLPSEV